MDERKYVSYLTGFAISLALTLAAFFPAKSPGSFHLSANAVIIWILALAIVQMAVQMIFFLHLGSGAERGQRIFIFAATVFIVLLFVIGSIWIMNHLNYNMMASPELMRRYMNSQQ